MVSSGRATSRNNHRYGNMYYHLGRGHTAEHIIWTRMAQRCLPLLLCLSTVRFCCEARPLGYVLCGIIRQCLGIKQHDCLSLRQTNYRQFVNPKKYSNKIQLTRQVLQYGVRVPEMQWLETTSKLLPRLLCRIQPGLSIMHGTWWNLGRLLSGF